MTNKHPKTIIYIFPSKKPPENFKRLLSIGYKIVAVTLGKDDDWLMSLCEQIIVIKSSDYLEESRNIIKELRVSIDGVMSSSDEGVLLRDALVDEGGWIGVSYLDSLAVKDKQSFHMICKNAGINVPKGIEVKNKKFIPSQIDLPLPWIVKPKMGVGSMNVKKIDTEKQMEEFFKNIDWDKCSEFIIEEYLPGSEVDIDILVQSGEIKFISIYDNHGWKEPYFLQLSGNIPSILSKDIQEELSDMAYKVVGATGISDACLHLEAMVAKDFVFPIELNIRVGGAETLTFNKGVYGVDLVEMTAKISVGEEIPMLLNIPAKCVMRAKAFMPEKTGELILKNIDKEVFNKKYLDEFHFFYNIGDTILSPPDGFALVGWFTVKAQTDIEARKYIDEISEMVEYDVCEE